jgi:Protein of unknown function (DUF1223)
LIGELERDPNLHGKVIPLSFHVDYWNRLGWRDPYSSPEWSQRQAAYVRAMNLDSPYTPQAIVDGSRQIVGSDRRSIYDAISHASQEPPVASISISGNAVHGSASRELDLFAAEVRDEAATAVKAGENSGRTMRSDAVVRKLTHVARVKGNFSQTVSGANVVFLQDPKTMRIYAAASARERPSAQGPRPKAQGPRPSDLKTSLATPLDGSVRRNADRRCEPPPAEAGGHTEPGLRSPRVEAGFSRPYRNRRAWRAAPHLR